MSSHGCCKRIGEEELDWKDKLGAQRREKNSPDKSGAVRMGSFEYS